jgi:ribosomal protein S18 acetylase RimI-like enzyme
VRPLKAREIPAVASIFRAAFNELYERRGYGPILPDESVGRVIAETYLAHDPDHCLVVEFGGRLAGSGFLHPRGEVAGIGPITIEPKFQARGLGRLLVSELCRRADRLAISSLRLIQDAFNENSYALYANLGFLPRRVLARASFPAHPTVGPRAIRAAGKADLPRIAKLEQECLGFSRRRDYDLLRRSGELFVLDGEAGLEGWLARIVRGSVAVLGPVLSRTSEGMCQLVADASADLPPATEVRLLLPAECGDLLAQLAPRGLEIHSLCNYMVRGSFGGIRGCYAPTLFPESG